jgi:four helix bundle protein
MFEDNVLYNKAYAFAVRMVKAYQYLKDEQKEFVLSKQLLRSGTSVGANIAEAHGAVSNAEFSMKLSIAYKEILETRYWLSLLKDTKFITETMFNDVCADAEEISKMLFSSVKKMRINNNK